MFPHLVNAILGLSTLHVIGFSICIQIVNKPSRTFEIDYEHDQFLKDGEPFRYISGSLHYFRVPRAYWRDRLRKYRAAGLNAISTYIDWSVHESLPGIYDFQGQNDVIQFVKEAQEEDLLVLLRPGPYICAERDLGGYPVWVLHENPNIILRTNNTDHNRLVEKWMGVLMPMIQPLLYGNGGPIIMVQVENEYGSYWACDHNYTFWLRDLIQSYVQGKAVLYTTDGYTKFFLKCGPVPGVFTTVDFGPVANVTSCFEPLREIQKHGPLVNSEFYPGHLTHWGDPGMSTEPIDTVVNTTRQLLQINASFNYYMFHGGTNFGLSSGANMSPFKPQITSYDFDAPISESGNLTEKYFAIKAILSQFKNVKAMDISSSLPVGYGTISMDPVVSLFSSETGVLYGQCMFPQTFETLGQYSGLMMYETVLPHNFTGKGQLLANNTHDRAIVYVNQVPVGVLNRTLSLYSLEIAGKPGQVLGLLVENQGHVNYGNLTDLKGITENVTLDGIILREWNHTGYPLITLKPVERLVEPEDVELPAYFTGVLILTENNKTFDDTFVDFSGWGKGVLYVNDVVVGRYWPAVGPQITLYLPGTLLRQNNSITIMELQTRHPNLTIAFVDKPLYTASPVGISNLDDTGPYRSEGDINVQMVNFG